MKSITKSEKNLSVTIEIDKESKFCLNSNNEIRYFDNDLLLKLFYDLNNAKIKGVFVYKFKAINENTKNKIIKNDNIWVQKQNSKIINGGIFTMLKNKGY